MNINIMIDDLRNDLVDTINKSGLPIAVVELICKELYIKVQNQYIATINSERVKDMKSPEEISGKIQETIDNDEASTKEALNEVFG